MFQRQCLKSSPTFFLREKRVIDYVYYLNFRKYLKSSSYLGWFSPFGFFFLYFLGHSTIEMSLQRRGKRDSSASCKELGRKRLKVVFGD